MRPMGLQPRAVLFSWIPCATILLSLFSRPGSADQLAKRDETNYFYNPPASGLDGDFIDNVAFTLGSLIDIAFVTDYPTLSLQICQQYGTTSASCAQLFREHPAVAQIQWRVSLSSTGFDLTVSQVFYFEVFNGDFTSTDTFTSHYFNIQPSGGKTTQSVVTAIINPTEVAATSTVVPITQTFTMTPSLTLLAGVASSAPSTSTSISTTLASSTPSSSASSTSKHKSNSLSQGAKIGIGVGVGVGGLCLALGVLIGFCLWRRGKQKSAEPAAEPHGFEAQPYEPYSAGGSSGYPSGFSVEPKYAQMQPYGVREELPVHEQPQELTGPRSPTQELPGSQPFQPESR